MPRTPPGRPSAARRVPRSGQASAPGPEHGRQAAPLPRLPRHASGEVIEILEREGRRELTVLLPAGAVLTVVDDAWDGHLGDSLVFKRWVSVETVPTSRGSERTRSSGSPTFERDRRRG